jgi:hypothetical protein
MKAPIRKLPVDLLKISRRAEPAVGSKIMKIKEISPRRLAKFRVLA